MERIEHATKPKGWRVYADTLEDYLRGDFYLSVTTVLSCVLLPGDKDFLLYSQRDTYDLMMERTAAVGDSIHSLIQNYVMGNPHLEFDEAVRPAFKGFCSLGLNLKGIDAEIWLHHDKYGYAGSADLFAYYKGQRTLVEIKTGQYRITAGWQLAAYYHAMKHLGLNPEAAIGLQLHRAGDDMKVFEYQHIDSCFSAFLCCLNIFRMANYNKLKKLNWRFLNEEPVVPKEGICIKVV